MSLLQRNSWRYLLRHPLQIVLAILGVALGVAVVVAIDLASASAQRAFSLSSETVTGRATDQIVGGPQGVDVAVYQRIQQIPGIASAPIIELPIRVEGQAGRAFRLLGVDPFSEPPFRPYFNGFRSDEAVSDFLVVPGSVLIGSDLASSNQLKPGSALIINVQGITRTVTVAGILDGGDALSRRALSDLVLADISTASELTGQQRRIDRIDLILPAEQRPQLQATLQSILPADTMLTTPASRTNAQEQMTASFNLNLRALSLLALLVGSFLIYNTMTFSVVQRRRLFGTLRTLGVTRREIFGLIMREALLIGGLGALIGVGMGIVLGRGLVQLVTQTINDLYFTVNVNNLALPPQSLLKGLGLGLGATLVAACVPALEAMLAQPRTVLRRSSVEQQLRRMLPRITGTGVLLALAGAGALQIPTRSLVVSMGGLFGILIGCALLVPALTLSILQLVQPLLARMFGVLGRMAARDVAAALSRTGVAIAALMVAVSVTVGAGTMIGSFRQTVVAWLNRSLQADIYISAPGFSATRATVPLDPQVVAALLATPGVDDAISAINLEVDSRFGPTALTAVQLPGPAHQVQTIAFIGDADSAWAGFQQGGVWISEPYAYRTGLGVGDALTLQTERGPHAFPVVGEYYDYASERGVVSMNRTTFDQYWTPGQLSSLAIWAAPEVDVDALVQRLQASAGERQALRIQANRTLREGTLVVFDRTFAITAVLQLLATIVAFIGVLSALMALQLDRARELGVLRAIGLTPRQLWTMIISQTSLMGLIAGLLALPVGAILAYVLVFIINKRSFGWTLSLHWDSGLFGQAVLLAVIAAVLAGIYPAWRMARSSPALALREE